ncbi:hypothetical protein U1Q18_038648 [Sarracenia purpurea var. burkii]
MHSKSPSLSRPEQVIDVWNRRLEHSGIASSGGADDRKRKAIMRFRRCCFVKGRRNVKQEGLGLLLFRWLNVDDEDKKSQLWLWIFLYPTRQLGGNSVLTRWLLHRTTVFSAAALFGIDFCQSRVSRRLCTPLIVRDSQNPVAARRHCATPPHRPHVLVACSPHFQSLPAPLHRCSTSAPLIFSSSLCAAVHSPAHLSHLWISPAPPLLYLRRCSLPSSPLRASVDLFGSDAICGPDAISPARFSIVGKTQLGFSISTQPVPTAFSPKHRRLLIPARTRLLLAHRRSSAPCLPLCISDVARLRRVSTLGSRAPPPLSPCLRLPS